MNGKRWGFKRSSLFRLGLFLIYVTWVMTSVGLSQSSTPPNVVQGYLQNNITDGIIGATIAGGGAINNPNLISADFGVIGGGANNVVSGRDATIGGGFGNRADALRATVSGGFDNAARDQFTMIGGGRGNEAGSFISTIGGGANNKTTGQFTTIGGGRNNVASGQEATIGGGAENLANGDNSTIGGGAKNSSSGENATIGGGGNHIASGQFASIGGGDGNIASALNATVSGGEDNSATAESATIGGGANNTAAALFAIVGGGSGNQALKHSATVSGGNNNKASGQGAVVGGGQSNMASGDFSFVGGGSRNTAAGNYGIALGQRGKIEPGHQGSFLFSDSQSFDFHSTTSDEFSVRAAGGIRFVSAIDQEGNPISGVRLMPGSNAWSMLSDRLAKENIISLDARMILERLKLLSISQWTLKSQDSSVLHIGPMAQDFYELFGFGKSAQYIHSGDLDGVALISIQALYRQLLDQEFLVEHLHEKFLVLLRENEKLKNQLGALSERVVALEEKAP